MPNEEKPLLNPIEFTTTSDTKAEPEQFLPESFGQRRYWGSAFLMSLLLLPIGTLKSVMQLLTGQPYAALKTLGKSLLAGIGIPILTFIGCLFPRKAQQIIGKVMVPAKLLCHEDDDEVWAHASHLYKETTIKVNNNSIETAHIDADNEQNTQCTIKFLGNAYTYKTQFNNHFYDKRNLNRQIRVFNYPDVSASENDLINAGIAQVYQLAAENKWDYQQVARNIQFYGHSLGGAVALQVAKFFKEKHNINIPVFVDRSFSSLEHVVAAYAQRFAAIPIVYAKKLTPLILKAAGWKLNSIEACNTLEPETISAINITQPAEQKPSKWERLKRFFGKNTPNADEHIPNGTAFTENVLTASSTTKALAKLTCRTAIYMATQQVTEAHSAHLTNLHVTDRDNWNGYDFYSWTVAQQQALAEDQPIDQSAAVYQP